MTEYKLKCRNIQQGIITPNHIQQQPQLTTQMHHDEDSSGDEDGDGGGED